VFPFIARSFVARCPHSPSVTCINNLRQLDGAKLQWVLEKRNGTNDVPSMTDISPYLRCQELAKWPVGGIYTLGAVGDYTRCSIKGHDLHL